MVRAVTTFLVPTIAAMAVDVPVALGAPTLPAPVLATTVAVLAQAPPAAAVASAARALCTHLSMLVVDWS